MELLKSLKFLEAATYVVAALVAHFAPEYALDAGVLLLAVVAVLKLFGIQPELQLKAMLKREETAKTVKVKAKK